MTPVTGDIDDLLLVGHLVQLVHVVQLDAVVDLLPEPAQQAHQDANRRVGDVGRNLERVLARLAPRDFLLANIVAGLGPDRAANAGRSQHLVDERSAVREVRADRRNATLPKVHAQDTRDLAVGDFARLPLHVERSQRQRVAKTQQRVTAVSERREELARTADGLPVLGKQQFQHRPLLLRRAPPVQRDRDQQKFLVALFSGVDDSLQSLRARHARMTHEQSLHAPQDDEALVLRFATKLERFRRRWQAVLRAGFLEREDIGETSCLEHIANRGIGIGDVFARVFRMNRWARPDREYLAGEPVEWPNNEACKVHGASLPKTTSVQTVDIWDFCASLAFAAAARTIIDGC